MIVASSREKVDDFIRGQFYFFFLFMFIFPDRFAGHDISPFLENNSLLKAVLC